MGNGFIQRGKPHAMSASEMRPIKVGGPTTCGGFKARQNTLITRNETRLPTAQPSAENAASMLHRGAKSLRGNPKVTELSDRTDPNLFGRFPGLYPVVVNVILSQQRKQGGDIKQINHVSSSIALRVCSHVIVLGDDNSNKPSFLTSLTFFPFVRLSFVRMSRPPGSKATSKTSPARTGSGSFTRRCPSAITFIRWV